MKATWITGALWPLWTKPAAVRDLCVLTSLCNNNLVTIIIKVFIRHKILSEETILNARARPPPHTHTQTHRSSSDPPEGIGGPAAHEKVPDSDSAIQAASDDEVDGVVVVEAHDGLVAKVVSGLNFTKPVCVAE